MSIKATKLKLGLPWNIGEVEFVPNEVQQRAAWSLYVELMTRIAIQPLHSEDGILREALSSLYAIFAETRTILKEAGPEVADGPDSFGPIAIRVLNEGIRPFLAKWHPLLKNHEDTKLPDMGQRQHEKLWPLNHDMRVELSVLQLNLQSYARVLAEIAGAV